MIINKVREYFLKCPLIDDDKQIRVDYLGVEEVEYTIDSVPVEPIIQKYADGGALKQFVFVFGSREYYGSDETKNMENSGFYEQFSNWLEEQSQLGLLPKLSGGKVARKIEATTQGYLFDASESVARYQIQCRLIYYEDK